MPFFGMTLLGTYITWILQIQVQEIISIFLVYLDECVYVCDRPPSCGVCMNYEVVEFQPWTV